MVSAHSAAARRAGPGAGCCTGCGWSGSTTAAAACRVRRRARACGRGRAGWAGTRRSPITEGPSSARPGGGRAVRPGCGLLLLAGLLLGRLLLGGGLGGFLGGGLGGFLGGGLGGFLGGGLL